MYKKLTEMREIWLIQQKRKNEKVVLRVCWSCEVFFCDRIQQDITSLTE